MLQFCSGSSANVNSRKAIRECLEIALEGKPNLDCDLLIIHTSMGHNFEELVKRMQIPIFQDKRLPWLGFYASGEFSRIGGKNGWNGFTSTLSMLYRNNE